MSRKKILLSNNPLFSGPPLEERQKGTGPYREITVQDIVADPNQPRTQFDEEKLKELAESIKTYGILNPILVRKTKDQGKYILVAGERRLRAAKLAGLKTVPALIDQSEDKSEERTLAMQLVENLQRADLAPLERAQAIGVLRDNYDLSIRDIAQKLGMSKSSVQRNVEILSLPEDLQRALKDGASESKVLLLAKIEDPEIRASYLKDIEVLTRNQIEKKIKVDNSKESDNKIIFVEDQRISEEIQRSLGLRTKIVRNSSNTEQGRLSIDFYSEEDLKTIFRLLNNDK